MAIPTRQAIKHSLHCLVGCGIGEILGMIIATELGWHKLGRVVLAVILAFLFGFLLTYRGVRKDVKDRAAAIKATVSTDVVSISVMELVDNTIEFIIPKALTVTVLTFRFWWGLVLSLGIAFIVTVPVNRYMMSNSDHHH